MPSATPPPGKLNTSRSILVAVVADEGQHQLALAGHLDVGRAVLVGIGMAADDDRLGPAGDEARHVLADDRFAEDDAAEDVADGAVRRAVHLVKVEFLHPRLVRRDGGAFDADADLLDRFGRFHRDPVAGLVALRNAEVVVEQFDVEIGMDQLVFDQLPDDAGHLVAVDFDDGILHFDLRHRGPFSSADGRIAEEKSGRRALAGADPARGGVAIAPGRRA